MPEPGNMDLKETTIGQLRYPLNDRENRYPMPAGGLFSTADDMIRFGQMLLNGGTFEGRRILSEESVRQMTSRQTAAGIPDSYGLGLSVGGDWFGHGGAFATNLTVNRKNGLVLVYMVQHAGFPKDGGEAIGAFHRAAAGLLKP
jgi:CubicO group peptidase (beta-lactamase class C family)